MRNHNKIVKLSYNILDSFSPGSVLSIIGSHFGDRDPNLDRWYHHFKRAGQTRSYWDYRVQSVGIYEPEHLMTLYFGNMRMAQLIKLRLSYVEL